MNIIETHNLNYKSLNNVLFKNINLEIEEGSFTSIIGENGVGKTTLLKILSGSIISDNYVKIDGLKWTNNDGVYLVGKNRTAGAGYDIYSSPSDAETQCNSNYSSTYGYSSAQDCIDNIIDNSHTTSDDMLWRIVDRKSTRLNSSH